MYVFSNNSGFKYFSTMAWITMPFQQAMGMIPIYSLENLSPTLLEPLQFHDPSKIGQGNFPVNSISVFF